ncbi:MAG: SH3 domain-containing protein [Bacteroidota bacterium]|nr:SH3 domain-containing protein [Bacteroidota bacterium]
MKARIIVLVLLALMVIGYAMAFASPETTVAYLSTSALNTDATAVHSGGSEAMAVNPEGSVARSDSVAADSESAQDGIVVTPEAAIEAYRNQDYKRSIELYEALVASGLEENRESAQLYYNLGNAYFRDHQLGKAILNYERAHLLAPGDSDIRHNLRYANNYTEDRITPASNLFLTNWFNGVRDLYSSNTWARLAVIFFVLFIACVALFLFVRVMAVRKAAFYIGLALLLFVGIANAFAFSQKRERVRREQAVVMVGAARANASPDENSNLLFELHEGTKVKIKSSDGNWYEIEIANGSVGWTLKKNVEVI